MDAPSRVGRPGVIDGTAGAAMTPKEGQVPEIKIDYKQGTKKAKESLKNFGKKLLLRTEQGIGLAGTAVTLPISWPAALIGRAIDKRISESTLDTGELKTTQKKEKVIGGKNTEYFVIELKMSKSTRWRDRALSIGSFGSYALYRHATDELKDMKRKQEEKL